MKKSLKDMVVRADAAKKVNPQDLSSDQDLTIGLMNMIAIEDVVPNSQIADMVRDMREHLMSRVVLDKAHMDVSRDLLAKSVALMNDGMRAFPDSQKAYECFDASYEAYAMFWGVNMGLVRLKDIKK